MRLPMLWVSKSARPLYLGGKPWSFTCLAELLIVCAFYQKFAKKLKL